MYLAEILIECRARLHAYMQSILCTVLPSNDYARKRYGGLVECRHATVWVQAPAKEAFAAEPPSVIGWFRQQVGMDRQ